MCQIKDDEMLYRSHCAKRVCIYKRLCFLLLLIFCYPTLAIAADPASVAFKKSTKLGHTAPRPPKYYSCPVHQSVRLTHAGRCPICERDLVPIFEPQESGKAVTVPKGQLREFCEKYIMSSFARIQDSHFNEAWLIISSYVDIKEEKAAPDLRKLLLSLNLGVVSTSAYYLGQLADRKSIPSLRCVGHSLHNKIFPKLDSVEQTTRGFGIETDVINAINAYVSILGSLYVMNDPNGQKKLVEFAQSPYGWMAYQELAQKKTARANAVLLEAVSSETQLIRAFALAALIHSGQEEYVQNAIEMSDSNDFGIRVTILDALSTSGGAETKALFEKILARGKNSIFEKLIAARALVLLGNNGAVEYITNVIEASKDKPMVRSALLELGRVGTKQQLPLLHEVIERDPVNRLWAVKATIEILKREPSF